MSSSALTSQGVTLAVGDAASPEVFTTISEINNLGGPGGQSNEIDVTDLSSTGKEYVLGLQDFGDVSCEMFYIPTDTQHAQLFSDYGDGTQRNYRITFTDTGSTTWTFAARVKGFSIDNGVDNVTNLSVVLRVTGAITVA